MTAARPHAPSSSWPAGLPLGAYRTAVALDEPFRPAAAPASSSSSSSADRLLRHVRTALDLLSTDPAAARLGMGADSVRGLRNAGLATARQALRAVLTVRDPGPLPDGAAAELDALLGGERLARPAVDARRLPTIAQTFPGTPYPAADRTVLWQGDITTLTADAIVNAANSALLGCFVPRHPCIDNAIHHAAGPRLRADCHLIMSRQNAPEPTGTAKITRGYHLPARYVLHTVGPIVDGPLRPRHEHALASAYRSCLNLAAEVDTVRTLAFCAVSTGVFGFPKSPAARIALRTVADWMNTHPGRLDRVVFTVFNEDDQDAYRSVLTNAPV
ncbi:protein-ADP-ribose hydrolase [Streptomyces sporangiiformans]|uniref:Protein-ADP-ribose hydrolase n=1 Tax=Streptomyces sporangiiformans TaxID=2315329 RepID=A0A505DRN6_9ACTN|nr:protein-ADP-ribose hydrolase [Streptomyces sporangiiformans]TPQ23974.1 protein-ADP-ribose hydrolase [Streptomyces sporangiiformans]